MRQRSLEARYEILQDYWLHKIEEAKEIEALCDRKKRSGGDGDEMQKKYGRTPKGSIVRIQIQ